LRSLPISIPFLVSFLWRSFILPYTVSPLFPFSSRPLLVITDPRSEGGASIDPILLPPVPKLDPPYPYPSLVPPTIEGATETAFIPLPRIDAPGLWSFGVCGRELPDPEPEEEEDELRWGSESSAGIAEGLGREGGEEDERGGKVDATGEEGEE
jgi:hypothetical protein